MPKKRTDNDSNDSTIRVDVLTVFNLISFYIIQKKKTDNNYNDSDPKTTII